MCTAAQRKVERERDCNNVQYLGLNLKVLKPDTLWQKCCSPIITLLLTHNDDNSKFNIYLSGNQNVFKDKKKKLIKKRTFTLLYSLYSVIARVSYQLHWICSAKGYFLYTNILKLKLSTQMTQILFFLYKLPRLICTLQFLQFCYILRWQWIKFQSWNVVQCNLWCQRHIKCQNLKWVQMCSPAGRSQQITKIREVYCFRAALWHVQWFCDFNTK